MLNSNSVLEVYEVHKSYGDVKALNGITFNVDKGELFGLIGPDGSGKSTLFRIMATLLVPDKGVATVFQYDTVKEYKKIRDIVGYMPGRFSLYPDLTVEENLNLFASLFGVAIKDNYHLIKNIYSSLEPYKERRADKLSGGMKQKLALCCALIHNPRLLYLDEPTTGVDPVSRREFWSILNFLKSEGMTIIVSTAYMDEALICDRVALMKDGGILSCKSPQEMALSYRDTLVAVWGENMPFLLNKLRAINFVKRAYSFGSEHHVSVIGERFDAVKEIEDCLKDEGCSNFYVKQIPPVIEDCYMELSS